MKAESVSLDAVISHEQSSSGPYEIRVLVQPA